MMGPWCHLRKRSVSVRGELSHTGWVTLLGRLSDILGPVTQDPGHTYMVTCNGAKVARWTCSLGV